MNEFVIFVCDRHKTALDGTLMFDQFEWTVLDGGAISCRSWMTGCKEQAAWSTAIVGPVNTAWKQALVKAFSDPDEQPEPATPINESPTYRAAMHDSGRGGLLS